jgi:hypothetical protein
MESELSLSFKDAVKRWLQSVYDSRGIGITIAEVTGWDEYVSAYGGCDTCGPETSTEVYINYVDSKGNSGSHTHEGNFGYLLTDILNA